MRTPTTSHLKGWPYALGLCHETSDCITPLTTNIRIFRTTFRSDMVLTPVEAIASACNRALARYNRKGANMGQGPGNSIDTSNARAVVQPLPLSLDPPPTVSTISDQRQSLIDDGLLYDPRKDTIARKTTRKLHYSKRAPALGEAGPSDWHGRLASSSSSPAPSAAPPPPSSPTSSSESDTTMSFGCDTRGWLRMFHTPRSSRGRGGKDHENPAPDREDEAQEQEPQRQPSVDPSLSGTTLAYMSSSANSTHNIPSDVVIMSPTAELSRLLQQSITQQPAEDQIAAELQNAPSPLVRQAGPLGESITPDFAPPHEISAPMMPAVTFASPIYPKIAAPSPGGPREPTSRTWLQHASQSPGIREWKVPRNHPSLAQPMRQVPPAPLSDSSQSPSPTESASHWPDASPSVPLPSRSLPLVASEQSPAPKPQRRPRLSSHAPQRASPAPTLAPEAPTRLPKALQQLTRPMPQPCQAPQRVYQAPHPSYRTPGRPPQVSGQAMRGLQQPFQARRPEPAGTPYRPAPRPQQASQAPEGEQQQREYETPKRYRRFRSMLHPFLSKAPRCKRSHSSSAGEKSSATKTSVSPSSSVAAGGTPSLSAASSQHALAAGMEKYVRHDSTRNSVAERGGRKDVAVVECVRMI